MRLPRLPRWVGPVALLVSACAAVLGLARGLTLAPELTNRLRDDAFYEFVWAANLAAGRGPGVSDGVGTSGVQVLWSLLLVPVAWCGGAAALPWVAPWLGFVLHVATAGLWFLRTRDRTTGACVALCWLGNPLLLRESQNGQETALACFLLAALWLRRRCAERWFIVLSVLTVMARSDLLPAVAALSLWRHRLSWRVLRAPVIAFGVHVGANLWLGGGWLPDSALPMAWLWHHNHASVAPDLWAWLQQSWWFGRPVLLGGPWAMASAIGLGFAVFAVLRPAWPQALRAVPALLVGCASASGARDLATPGWAALFLALWPRSGPRPVPRGLALLLCAVGAIVVLHWAIRWYPRDYYIAPLVVAAAAAVARFGRWRAVLLLLAVAQIQDWRRVEAEPLQGQREMEMAGRFVAKVLPPTERIGCFNSGIVTFHTAVVAPGDGRRGIVNLDGVVDSRAFAALRQARLGAWLDEQRIRFVLDNPVQFSLDATRPHACGRWFGGGFDPDRDLVEVARFAVAGSPGMRLYWRRGRGDAPARTSIARDLGPGPDGGRYVLWPATPGQVLEGVDAAGERVPVVVSDATTSVVVLVPPRALAGGALFVQGSEEPVLSLPKL